MSAKELDRLEVLRRVVERLCRAPRSDGASGLVSRKRCRPSNEECDE